MKEELPEKRNSEYLEELKALSDKFQEKRLWEMYSAAALTGFMSGCASDGDVPLPCETVIMVCDYAEAMIEEHKKRWG